MSFGDSSPTVLLAEHERAALEMMQIRLSVAGYGTTMARTGSLALQALQSCRPSVLVLDRDLPELNGFQVLEMLYPRGEKPPFPVLLLARAPSGEDIQRALRLGVRDVLTKPFSGADVVERVARLLRAPASPARKVA